MEEKKKVFKKTCYLLMIITLTIMAFFTPKFIEKEVNAEITSSGYSNSLSYKVVSTYSIEEIYVNGIKVYYDSSPNYKYHSVDLVEGTNIVRIMDLLGYGYIKTVIVDLTAPTIIATGVAVNSENISSWSAPMPTVTDNVGLGDLSIIYYYIYNDSGNYDTVSLENVRKYLTNSYYDMYVKYKVYDLVGHYAETDMLKITLDDTVPTLLTTTITSDNANNTEFAKIGDTITLSFTVSENIRTIPTVTIAGQTATVTGSEDTYVATYTVVEDTPEGVVAINITYVDDAENIGTPGTTTTNSSTVTIDTAVPILEAVTIKSDNDNAGFAKEGDTITLSITASEDIQTPIVTIAGQPATVTGSGDTYTATYIVEAGTPEGVAGIDIRFIDDAGNDGTVEKTTDSSTVTVDKIKPTPLTVTVESDNNNLAFAKIGDTITVKFTASEEVISLPTVTPTVTIANQKAQVTGSGDSYEATYIVVAGTPEGVAEISITYNDLAGNAALPITATTNSSTVTVDKTKPTLSAVTMKSDNDNIGFAKERDTITLSITASEDIQIATVIIAGQTATITGSGDTYTATYKVESATPEGVAGIEITYTDEAGNAGTLVTATTNSSTVVIHKTTPALSTVTIESDNSDRTSAKVGDTITVMIIGIDIQTPTVIIAGQTATVTKNGHVYYAAYKVESGTLEGVATFEIIYTDMAGNAGTVVTTTTDSSTVTVDTAVPTLEAVTIESDNQNIGFAKLGDTITLTIIARENIEISIVEIAGQTAAISGSGDRYTATTTVRGGTPEGVTGIKITYTDMAGNTGTPVTATTNSSTVTVDKTEPTLKAVTIESNNDNTRLAKSGDVITLAITASEDIQTPTVTIAGQTATIAGSGNTYTATYTVLAGTSEGVAGINITYVDEAGHTGTVVTGTTDLSTVKVDKTLPKLDTVTIASNNSNTVLAKGLDVITVSITASEDIKTPTVEVAGKIANVTGSGKIYTATYTVAVGTPEGVAEINITYDDLAGNAGTVVTATTNSSVVTVDKTKPTLNTVTIRSNNNNTALAKVGDEISVTIIANENIQTPTVTIAGQVATISGSGDSYTATYTVVAETPEGVAGINITYTDEAGNVGTAVTATTDSNTVRIHTSAQALPYVGIASNNRYNTELAKVGDLITLTIITDEDIQTPTVTIAGETATVKTIYSHVYAATYKIVERNSEGAVVFNIIYTDGAGNAATVIATTDSSTVIVDKTPPTLKAVTISSNGNNAAFAKVGDTITVLITASESIKTPTVTIAGKEATISGSGDTYTAIYTVVAGTPEGEAGINITYDDETGNAGAAVTATTDSSTVTVDTAVPTLEAVTIESDNRFSTALAKVGDTITVSITANENIQTPIVTIAGQTATVTGSEDKYTAKYIVVEGTPEGEAAINITYTDEAGHAGTVVTATTNSSTVTVDITESILPTLPIVTIESNNQFNTAFAKVGDTITISIIASRNIQTPAVTIVGATATVTGSGYTYVATYTVVEETPEGVVGINITYVDEAGNTGIPVIATTNSSTVTVEKTLSKLLAVRIVSNNVLNTEYAIAKDTIILSITVGEQIETPTITIAGQAATVIGSEGTYIAFYMVEEGTSEGIVPFNITYVDEAGNVGTPVTATTDSSTVTIVEIVPVVSGDKIAPVIYPVDGAIVNLEDIPTWTAPEATANDDVDGEINDDIVITYYKEGGTLLTDLDAARTELATGRNVIVKYNVNDSAGNAAVEVSATFKIIIGVTPTITRGNWTLSREYVFTASEPIVEYSLDGGSFIAIDPPVGGEYTVSIGDNLRHQLVLKDAEDDLSDVLPIEAKGTGNDNLMFYASKGLLPWDSDSNWEYNGTGLITPDILDADGNCKNEYGEGAVCYKIYELDIDGEQVKVLQQLDDSNTVILEMIRKLDVDDYNNLYRNGGSVKGRFIVPSGDTYAGAGDPNNGNYAGNADHSSGNVAFVGLQFETLPDGSAKRRYGLSITQVFSHVRISTVEGSVLLNGDSSYPIGHDMQRVDLPFVKIGDPLDFELRIPKTAGAIGILPKAEIYVNGVYIGKTNFNTFGEGSTGNKLSIGSGSTGGENIAILIEKFESIINTADIDVLAPVSAGADAVENSTYTFESNEKLSGYQLDYENWVTIAPTFKITDILLSSGANILRVRDISGNIASYTVYYHDTIAPTIRPIYGEIIEMEGGSSWIAPTTTANDDMDGDISDNIVVTYFNADETIELADLDAARTELTAGRNVVVKYNVSDIAGNAATEVSVIFRVKRLGMPTITRGNWTLLKQYVFTTNEPIVEYSLDGDNFIAIDPPVGGEYTITIGDDLLHQLVLKDAENDLSNALPIEAKATSNDNLMFYASKGLLPWDSDANWEYRGTGSITPNILDADGNCKNEYGEGAACYKIYELNVDGKQVKVLQQLDDSSTTILQTVKLLNVDDYNNLYSNGGSVKGRVILPYGNTYAGIGDPNTQNYAGNSQAVGYGAFVGLQFEPEMIPGGNTKRRYGMNITYSGEYVKIATSEGHLILNGNTGFTIGDSEVVDLPEVKIGEPLDFKISIPSIVGTIGILPQAEIFVNGIYVGETNFGLFGGGSTGNKVSIGSGSTGGTNRAILIENFGIQINTDDIDVSVPASGGATIVDNPIYTFESNEELSGYQLNNSEWVTVEPTFQITDIILSGGQNDLRVHDISGNIATYNVNVNDTIAPVINHVDGAGVSAHHIQNWKAPRALVTDNIDVGLIAPAAYFKADRITSIDLTVARTELAAGRNVIVKYNVTDNAGNAADEVEARFTAPTDLDTTAPIITSPSITYNTGYNLTANEKIAAYSINNGLSWVPIPTPSDSIIVNLTPGGTYRMMVKDVAGNVSIMKTVICDA